MKTTLSAIVTVAVALVGMVASGAAASGILYGSNGGNGDIYRIDPGAGNATLFVNVPTGIGQGIAFDPSNNLYVAANNGTDDCIVKVTPDLVQSDFCNPSHDSGRNLAADAAGNIYAATDSRWPINPYKYTPDGVEHDLGPTGSGNITIASSPAGVLYTSGYGGDGTSLTVQKYDPATSTWSTFYDPGINQDYPSYSHQAAVDVKGNYLLADGLWSSNNHLARYNADGTRTVLAMGGFTGVVVDPSDGMIYASDYATGNIYSFNPDGSNQTLYASGFSAFKLAITNTTVQPPTLHPGDANGDGVVDLQDFGSLKDSFGATTGATWAMGDFNGDGAIDLQDFGILKDHFGHTNGDSPVTAVPEPTTLSLLALSALALRRKR